MLTPRLGTKIIVEVKQFEPNREERALLARRANGDVVVMGATPGERVRRAIRSAGPQLKALAVNGEPCLLVVYDAFDVPSLHTRRYAVLTAMRGLDVIPVDVPEDPGQPLVLRPVRPGPRKKMTPAAHTSISGIGVISAAPTGATLDVFHNPHATYPLIAEALSAPSVQHWRMSGDQSDWVPIDHM